MILQIKKLKVLYAWVILIILTSFSFCNIHSLFKIKNNSINIPETITNDNNYSSNYISENKNILLQINILTSTLLWNNIVYKKYSNVFNHNMNYVLYQKNYINKKINYANSTIIKEIKVLKEMKDLLENHEYNYLQLYQIHNYHMPNMTLKNKSKNLISINNIKTYANKINKSTTTMNSISFKCEEFIIGGGSISALISSSKLLLLSKIKFNYNNFFYFSNYLNNLTNLNKLNNTSLHYDRKRTGMKNKFLNQKQTDIHKKFDCCTKSLAKKNCLINYITHKPYIVTLPLFIIGGVIIVVLSGRKIGQKRCGTRPDEKDISSSSNSMFDESKNHGKLKVPKSSKLSTLKQDLNNDEADPLHLENLLKRELIQRSSIRDIPKLLEIMPDKNQHHSINVFSNNDFKIYPSDYYDYMTDRSSKANDNYSSSTKEMENFVSDDSLELPYENHTEILPDIFQESEQSTQLSKVYISNEVSKSGQLHDLQLLSGNIETLRELVPAKIMGVVHHLFDKDKLMTEYGSESQKSLIKHWFDAKEGFKKMYIDELHKLRLHSVQISRENFSKQVAAFFYRKDLIFKLETTPQKSHILRHIKARCNTEISISGNLEKIEENDAIAKICTLLPKQVIPVHHRFTTYGWFLIPCGKLSVEKSYKNLTDEQKKDIIMQKSKFENIEELLPVCDDCSAYYDRLLKEFNYFCNTDSADSSIKLIDKFIANEILLDIKELVGTYKLLLKIPEKSESVSPSDSCAVKIRNYVAHFGNTKIVWNNFELVDNLNIGENKMFMLLEHFLYL